MSVGQTVRHRTTNERSEENLEGAIERVRRAGGGISTRVFLARALNAIASVASELDERSLTVVAGAPSDYDVLLQVLEEPETATRLKDPLASARLRGLRLRERLLAAEGGSISAAEVADLLHISRQAVNKRRRAGHLIGLSIGRHGYFYPTWQFNERGELLPGLKETLDILANHDPWMQAAFFLNPNASLNDVMPLALLRSGDIAMVLHAARLYGEQRAA
jgi:hypothetical protein